MALPNTATDNTWLQYILGYLYGGQAVYGGDLSDTNNVLLKKIAYALSTAAANTGGGGGSVSWASITGKPTTLNGFGITDGLNLAGGNMSGPIKDNSGVNSINAATRKLYDSTGSQVADYSVAGSYIPVLHRIVFTPANSTDLYRVLDETITGGMVSGRMRVSGVNAAGQAWDVLFTFQLTGSAGGFPFVTQTYCTPNHRLVHARLTSNGTNRGAVDLQFDSESNAVTVDIFANPLANPITTPASGMGGLGSDFDYYPFQSALQVNGNLDAVQVSVGLNLSNGMSFSGGGSGSYPYISAYGAVDADVGFSFNAKGTGRITTNNYFQAPQFAYDWSGPYDTAGSGVPVASLPNGSTYRNRSGVGILDNFYIRRGGVWVGIA